MAQAVKIVNRVVRVLADRYYPTRSGQGSKPKERQYGLDEHNLFGLLWPSRNQISLGCRPGIYIILLC